MRIDAHHHFWRLARGDYPWLTAEAFPTLCRDFTPADLAPLIQAAGIDRTILVQAAESLDETRFLLAIADETPFVAGVVGWADFAASTGPADIDRLAEHCKLVSLRPMLQEMTETDWILRPEREAAFVALQRAGLAFDLLIKPPHLPHIPALADRYPTLHMVIDHAAKPYIAAGEVEPWATRMRDIARRENVWCKLSGLATEAGEAWDAGKLKPYVEVLLEAFGPARLMWGSDWPVLLTAASYAEWLAAARQLTGALSETERALIFGGAAASFYGLDDV